LTSVPSGCWFELSTIALPSAPRSACGRSDADSASGFAPDASASVSISAAARASSKVIQQRGDTYEELARIPTIAGARTALLVPERNRLYLAVRASGGEGAAVWIFQPTP
jgi:hypothetical protein